MKKLPAKSPAKARAKKDNPKVRVAYTAPRSEVKKLDELANSKGVSRNALLNLAVSRLLEEGIR